MRGEVEMGASRGMMVLLVKQVHLQNEVGEAADVRGRRAERERMRVVGSMARGCLVDGERGRGRLVESCENYS